MNSFPWFLVGGLIVAGFLCLFADAAMGRWVYCTTCGRRIKPPGHALLWEGAPYCCGVCIPSSEGGEPAAYRKASSPPSALGRPWYARR